MGLSEPIVRGMFVAALVLLVGIPPTILIAVTPVERKFDIDATRADSALGRIVAAALLAAFFAIVAGWLFPFLQPAPGAPASPSAFFVTERGLAVLLQVSVVVCLGFLTVAHVRGRIESKSAWQASVLGGGLLLLASFCWINHSSAVPSDALAATVKFGHMLGAALWVGGLVVLAIVVPRLLEANEDASEIFARVIRRFSVVAVAGVTLAFATGFLITSWHVPRVSDLWTTAYGVALSVKIVAVLIAAALGGLNRVVLLKQIQASRTDHARNRITSIPGLLVNLHGPVSPGNPVRTLVRSVRLELLILAAVVLSSVTLTSILTAPFLTEPAGASALATVYAGNSNSHLAILGGSALVGALRLVALHFEALLHQLAGGISVMGLVAIAYEVGVTRGRRNRN